MPLLVQMLTNNAIEEESYLACLDGVSGNQDGQKEGKLCERHFQERRRRRTKLLKCSFDIKFLPSKKRPIFSIEQRVIFLLSIQNREREERVRARGT